LRYERYWRERNDAETMAIKLRDFMAPVAAAAANGRAQAE